MNMNRRRNVEKPNNLVFESELTIFSRRWWLYTLYYAVFYMMRERNVRKFP